MSKAREDAPVFRAPLKPRKGLFYLLLGLVAVWVAGLLTTYCVTVYPNRQPPAPAPPPPPRIEPQIVPD